MLRFLKKIASHALLGQVTW